MARRPNYDGAKRQKEVQRQEKKDAKEEKKRLKKEEAATKVPSEMLRNTNLVGPAGYVKERIAAYQEAGVTHLSVTPVGGNPVATVEQLRALID